MNRFMQKIKKTLQTLFKGSEDSDMIDLVEYNEFVRATFTDVRDFKIFEDSFFGITALAVEYHDSYRVWRRCLTYAPLYGSVGFYGLEIRNHYGASFGLPIKESDLRLSNFETRFKKLDELKAAVKMTFDVKNNFEHIMREEKIRSAAEGYVV